MTQAYDRIIATITTASDATEVTKTMVKSTEWRAGTSGDWNATDCTLTASNVYQFRTPLSGMSLDTTAILPNIKASVIVDWDATATAITTVGNYFMAYYAGGCSSLTSLLLPSTTGWFTSNDVSWSVPSARLGYLKGYAPNSTAQTAWQALTVSGKTLYINYIQSEDDVESTATGSNYTLTCAAGSYSLTGTDADLYRSLVMACEAGSYALTGSDATFNANYVFALGMGRYVLVGTACGLFILSPTPACRTATIEFENRTLEVKCH